MRIRSKYNLNYVFISKDAMFLYDKGYCMSNVNNNSITRVNIHGNNFYQIIKMIKTYNNKIDSDRG